jgi:hypothetical protein
MVIIQFIPSLIAALVVLLVGLIVAHLLRALVIRVIDAIRLDVVLNKAGVGEFMKRAGFSLRSGKFLGDIVFWFFVIVTVLASSDIVGLWGLSAFLGQVLLFFPTIIVAALIVLASVLVGHMLRGLIRGSVKGAQLHAAHFLGSLAWWASVIFGVLAALIQLGVGEQIIQTIITGVIAMMALAGGIAFGLGGKDYAADVLKKLRDRME